MGELFLFGTRKRLISKRGDGEQSDEEIIVIDLSDNDSIDYTTSEDEVEAVQPQLNSSSLPRIVIKGVDSIQ